MADAISTMKNKAQDVSNSIGQTASCAADNVKHAAGNMADAARGMAANLSKEGQQAASYLGQRAEDATSAVGGQLKAAGDTLRHNAPRDGALGQASCAVAKTLEETGDYLQREGLEGIATDMSNMIKRNPIPSLFMAIGVGFLLARATTPRT